MILPSEAELARNCLARRCACGAVATCFAAGQAAEYREVNEVAADGSTRRYCQQTVRSVLTIDRCTACMPRALAPVTRERRRR